MNMNHHSRTSGQSIPFIALIIVVLFGMVGLAVDVGNTHAQQREVVRAANAAALAGMNTLIQSGDDAVVRESIDASLEANGIEVANDSTGLNGENRRLEAYYLGSDGNPLVACNIGTCGGIPTGVTYIQVKLEGFTNTYFARIVDRDTLPVGTQSFVGQCPPVHNVYPIGVPGDYLDDEGFVEPSDATEMDYYGRYIDENYSSWQRRIYLKDDVSAPGGFSFLRWLSTTENGNTNQAIPMFEGDGNLDEGFEEAEWPDGFPGEPTGYPLKPGVFTPGDWVHGSIGNDNLSALESTLSERIDRRTVVILPIIADNVWGDDDALFNISGFGAFLIRDYDQQPGRGWYMDMVYLGEANKVPCPLDNPPTDLDSINVKGEVFLFPRQKEIVSADQPIDYVMILDTSGSMNWNFAGQARKPHNAQQCTYNPATPDVQVKPCNSKKWNNKQERRIYFAKEAIIEFIDDMNENDAMQILGFSSKDYSMKVSGTRELGTAQGKADLKQAVYAAGGKKYEGGGGTPSPRALLKSRDFLANSPATAPNGKEYQQVVIFLTDGVANHFDQKYNVPWGNNQWFNRAKDDSVCAANQPGIGENISCQTGYVNDDVNGIKRPITSMIYQGELLQQSDVVVYAMMMGAADATGLDRVASQPTFPWYSVAQEGTDVEQILEKIRVSIDEECQPAPTGVWINRIEPENEPGTAPEYGTLVLYDENDVEQARVPVVHDQTTGQLTYEINDITPGTYTIKHVWVNYVGEDGVERTYSQITNRESGDSMPEITFEVSPSDTLNDTVVAPIVNLDLNGNVCPVGTSGP